MSFAKSVAAALLLFAAVGAAAAPRYRSPIAASGYAGETELANFPVLVRISQDRISGFFYTDCANDGSDISFVDEDGGALAYEIDTWNADGESLVWVRIPAFSNTTKFYMRWCDSNPQAVTASDTWKSDYVGVWHLGEASGTCANSTSNGSKYDAEPWGVTEASLATNARYSGTDAPVGGARTTTSAKENVSCLAVPNYDDEQVGSTFTVSGWVYASSYATQWPRIFARKSAWNISGGWEVQFENYETFLRVHGSETSAYGTAVPATWIGEWTHLLVAYEGTTCSVYLNGALLGSGSVGSAPTDNGLQLGFGCIVDKTGGNTGGSHFVGSFDECRLMKGAASADWAKAEYDTVKEDSFLTIGDAEMIGDATALAIGNVSVAESGDNYVTFTVNVLGIGANAESATFSFAYGESESAITETQASDTVDSTGLKTLTLKRLRPGCTYYVKITLANDQNESDTSGAIAVTAAPSTDVTDGDVPITVAERFADGAWSGLDLSFAASDAARELFVASGPVHGGEERDGWANVASAGTVEAGATSFSYALPESWGTDDNLVVRFFFVEDDAPAWSPSTYWHPAAMPVVSALTLDGTGGDTIVVDGSVLALGASPCVLSVLTGTSATQLTQVWSDFDGSSRTEAGAFSFSLFEADVDSSRCIVPGETCFVCVEATANGVTSRSPIASVKTSDAAVFDDAPTLVVSRRTVNVSGRLTDLGMGSSPSLTLWVGANEASLAQVDAEVTLSGSSYSASYALPEFEKTYVVQVRATNMSVSGTATLGAKSKTARATTRDLTTYTWIGGNGGAWSDKANWDDGHGGDALGYPRVTSATAAFSVGSVAVVAVDASYSIGTLDCGAQGADVTLVRAESLSSAPTLSCTTFEPGRNSGRTVLDGITMNRQELTFCGGRTLVLTNAASLAIGRDLNCYNDAGGGTLVVAAGSTLSTQYGNIGPCTIVIDDATITVANGIRLYASKGAETTFRFLGTAPQLQFTGGDPWLGINDNADSALSVTMEFVVPNGGYATPPVQRLVSTGSRYFGMFVNADKVGGTMSAVVRSDSPGAAAKEEFSTTLISWPGVGISQDFVTEVLLPKARNSFSWEDPTSSGRPASLSVTLGGRKGLVLKVL